MMLMIDFTFGLFLFALATSTTDKYFNNILGVTCN